MTQNVGVGPPPDGNRNLGPVIIAVNWIVFVPAWIIVLLRTYTRVWIGHNFGWDDATMLLTQVINTVGISLVMLEVHYGLGRHIYYFQDYKLIGFLKYNYLDWVQVFVTLAICKISICLFLLRISKFDKYRRVLWGMIAFLVLSHLPLTLLYILQCVPVYKVWYQQAPGTCFSMVTVEKIVIVQGVFSILTDLIAAAIPVLLLRNMHLPARQKIALEALMGLGIITALFCIIRTVFSYEIPSPDITWNGVPNALCRILEINLGIIASCMPMMRHLYTYLHKRFGRPTGSESLASNRTSPSKLQWYKPPTQTPWYRRIHRSLWHPPPPLHSSMDSESPAVPHGAYIPEKAKNLPKPIPRAEWPQRYERPANATWAKDTSPKMSGSFDLPFQGPRKDDFDDVKDGEKNEELWGSYQFHREDG